MIDLRSLFGRLRSKDTERNDPDRVALKAIERVSGVNRKTILRWRYTSPTLDNLVSVVEAMGGRVVVEVPVMAKSWCKACQGETVSLSNGSSHWCGRCGEKKDA
jgi:hypothetical protein